MSVAAQDLIEILPVEWLDRNRGLVTEFRAVAEQLSIGLGWHYLLDLSWSARHLEAVPGQYVLDAGAGTGAMQWWLAEKGIHVLSVDKVDRSHLRRKFRAFCPVRGLRESDLKSLSRPGLQAFLPAGAGGRWTRWPLRAGATLADWAAGEPTPPATRGTVTLYHQDLGALADIKDGTFDAVVSISALEHNPPDRLRAVARELMRILKPGGRLVATLAAAKDRDWFHEPSRGWCYTETSLREAFGLDANAPSNYPAYDKLFEALANCAELRDNLAALYFRSGNNGMPWGVWDPKYQPVGIVKVKPC